MIGGDDTNELVCYYTWSADTVDPTGVHIPDLAMIVEDRRLLSYEITPSNADVYMDKVFNRFIKEVPYRNSIKIIGLKIIEMQSFPVWLSMKRIIRNILLFG